MKTADESNPLLPHDIKTLNDFLKDTRKGSKFKYLDTDEDFSKIFDLSLNSALRNAIGHGSYSVDGVNQVISFYPSRKKDESKKKSIFLIQFIEECWLLFQMLHVLNELVYQTTKFHLVFEGHAMVKPDVFKIPPAEHT